MKTVGQLFLPLFLLLEFSSFVEGACSASDCESEPEPWCCDEGDCGTASCYWYNEPPHVQFGKCVCEEEQCLAISAEAGIGDGYGCFWDSTWSTCVCELCDTGAVSKCSEEQCNDPELAASCVWIEDFNNREACICTNEQCKAHAYGAGVSSGCSWNDVDHLCTCESCTPEDDDTACIWNARDETCECANCHQDGTESPCGQVLCEVDAGCLWNEDHQLCICTQEQCDEIGHEGDVCDFDDQEIKCSCSCGNCSLGDSSCCLIEEDCNNLDTSGNCIFDENCICTDEQCQAMAEEGQACWFDPGVSCDCNTCDSCSAEASSCCNEILCGSDTGCVWLADECICSQAQCEETAADGETCEFNKTNPDCTCTCTDCADGKQSCCDDSCLDGNGVPDSNCFVDSGVCVCNDRQCDDLNGDATDESCFWSDSGCVCDPCTDCKTEPLSCCNERSCQGDGDCEWDIEKHRCVCSIEQCSPLHDGEVCTWSDTDSSCTCHCAHCEEGSNSCCEDIYTCLAQESDKGCFWDYSLQICICSDHQCDNAHGGTDLMCKLASGACLCETCTDCAAEVSSCCNEPGCGAGCEWVSESKLCICNDGQCNDYLKPEHEGETCGMVNDGMDNYQCICSCTDCDAGETSCCEPADCPDCDASDEVCRCTNEQCQVYDGNPRESCTFEQGTPGSCVCEDCDRCDVGKTSCCHQFKCEEFGGISECFYDSTKEECFCTAEQCETDHAGHPGETCDISGGACMCTCTDCTQSDTSCCDDVSCTCNYENGVCACTDEQCQNRDGDATTICVYNGASNSCDCVSCNCADGTESCCLEDMCTEVPCYYDTGLEGCICTQEQCEAFFEDTDHPGVECIFEEATTPPAPHLMQGSCDCSCAICSEGEESCCDENSCGAECFWDIDLKRCFCTDHQCQYAHGLSYLDCVMNEANDACDCSWCEDCKAGAVSCCSSEGKCDSDSDCEWTGEICICTDQQCTEWENPDPGYSCKVEMIGEPPEPSCGCECDDCSAGGDSCCSGDDASCLAAGCYYYDDPAFVCVCTDEQCQEYAGTEDTDCIFVSDSAVCDCVTCASCAEEDVSCCTETRCDADGGECYWDEEYSACICNDLQCAAANPDALDGEECTLTGGKCGCVCTGCEPGAVSCCDQNECSIEGSAYDSECHWAKDINDVWGCFCNDTQCQAGFGEEDQSCYLEQGACVCNSCASCAAGSLSCCNVVQCDEEAGCFYDTEFEVCICNELQCETAGGEQAPGHECYVDHLAEKCVCQCQDCTVSGISCCNTEPECVCLHEDAGTSNDATCHCYWDEESTTCFCSDEQCEELAGAGEVCTLGESGCVCSASTTTQPPDVFGHELEGVMAFMDFFYRQIPSPLAFSQEFVEVAAKATGAAEFQFVEHSVHRFADVGGATGRLLRGQRTSVVVTGVINDDSAAEYFKVVDDVAGGVSAARVMTSLNEQLKDETSSFYSEFITKWNMSGGKLDYQPTPEAEDNTWKIIGIVFITIFVLLVVAIAIWATVVYCRPKKEAPQEPEEEESEEVDNTWKMVDEGGMTRREFARRQQSEREKTGAQRHSRIAVPKTLVQDEYEFAS